MKSGVIYVAIAILGLAVSQSALSAVIREGHETGKGGGQAPPHTPDSHAPPLATLEGVHLEEYTRQGKTLELWSETARIASKRKDIRLKGLRLQLLTKGKNGNERMILKGERAVYDLRDQRIVVTGGVEILTDEGYRLRTPTVLYERGKRKISGTGPVQLESQEGWITAKSFVADMEEDEIQLRGDVKTLLRPSAISKAKEVLK